MDTGAVHNLSGGDAVRRQNAEAMEHGVRVSYATLMKPKRVSGVGDQAKSCKVTASIPGVRSNGEAIVYETPVVSGDPSPLPGLYGLISMASEQTYFGTHNGLMVMIPKDADNKIQWPYGTRFNQCDKAPSGHWIMTTSNCSANPMFARNAKGAAFRKHVHFSDGPS